MFLCLNGGLDLWKKPLFHDWWMLLQEVFKELPMEFAVEAGKVYRN